MYASLAVGANDIRHVQVRLGPRLQGATTLEACARAVCDELHARLVIGEGTSRESACALVRCFATQALGALEPALQERCLTLISEGVRPSADIPCFVLLASAGDEPAWRSRHTAGRHRVIPLPSQEALNRLPMVSALFGRFNVRLADIRPAGWGVAIDAPHAYDVFHVEDAVGSPSVPDQDGFVRPYGVRSVVAFGCACRHGDLFIAIIFSKVPLASDAVRRVRALALDVAANVFRVGDGAVFDSTVSAASSNQPGTAIPRAILERPIAGSPTTTRE